ncbi:hypothetical protein [Psychromonas sp.]|uniref:hypothetical protein n=1 Tax=Psychromonas sp. TaxID=1884585 RepID=UPI00356738F6
MHKTIEITVCSKFSPTCQLLINEVLNAQAKESKSDLLDNCSELLVVRLQGAVIAFCTVDVIDGEGVVLGPLHLRDVVEKKELINYWLPRLLKRHLILNPYPELLAAS